jgi:hypothetical protein
MSKQIVKDKEYPNGWKLTAYITPSDNPSTNQVEDKIEGFGQYIAADGTRVQGIFDKNKLNGIGFTQHIDGQEYVGMYKDNVRSGMGCVYLGNKMFTGKFDKGKISGFGEVEMLSEDVTLKDIGAELGDVSKYVKPADAGEK